jgi:hypothetical protein
LAVHGQLYQRALEDPVIIPLIVADVLKMPDQFAGVGIDREGGIGVKRIIRDARFLGSDAERAGIISLRDAEIGEV